jgi:hypothetical protein
MPLFVQVVTKFFIYMKTTTTNKGKGKAASEAKAAAETMQNNDSNINVSLPALFNHSLPTRQETRKIFKSEIIAEIMGFFAWYNTVRKDFGKLCNALELHRQGKTTEAAEAKSKLTGIALAINDLITINRGEISLAMVDQILLQGDAKPMFAASDFLAKKEFANYEKRVNEGKAAKDANGVVKPYKPSFDGKMWTAERFTKCFLLACNSKHIKEQKALEAL